jgi:hypothetical protein
MLVYGEAFATDPDFQDGQTEFWCLGTSRLLGPDGEDVSLDSCSDPQRSCFREF